MEKEWKWRVVFMAFPPRDCESRADARRVAAETNGKVQGYMWSVGWVDDSMIPEEDKRGSEVESGFRA